MAAELVKDFMTQQPHTIGNDISLQRAQEKMRELSCRHLPVLHGGKLVGVLSERDVSIVSSFAPAETTPVEEAMSSDVYVVSPDATLKEVSQEMFKHKFGSAIVSDGPDKPLGIFTVTDALAALIEKL